MRQTAANASIIKSGDYGTTWLRSAEENLRSPMFPGSSFATPYFIEYSRTHDAIDGSDRFVYAISNNGFWDNGDLLTLGRVPRQRIGDLKGIDWEYRIGGDGALDASWSQVHERSKPIVENPGRLGETGATYIPALRRYILIGWYYPDGSGKIRNASKTTVWDFYESPKPWGPWAHITSKTFSPAGYYCPMICPKFQSGSRVYACTGGDFNNAAAF